MTSMNQCFFTGNLTADPELRRTPNGVAVCTFSLGVNRTWKDKNGDVKEDVFFPRLTAWDKAAEVLAQYLKKGDPVSVRAYAKTDTWDDKQTGEKRSAVAFTVEWFQFLGGKRDGNGQGNRPGREAPQRDNGNGRRDDWTPPREATVSSTGEDVYDSIPF